jgi:L-asparaginase
MDPRPRRYSSVSSAARKTGMLAKCRASLVLVVVFGCAAPAFAQNGKPKVLVLGTGGTIAGEQQQPGTLGSYQVKKSVNEIVSLIPHVQQYATVETEQFANVGSPSITPDHWLRLARRINDLFVERPDVAGVVVTHGTSRLEETAFFLYLTVTSDRPVVVVGAQRPPTGISPDGPINLLSAIRVAAAPESRGKGVTVVMDDRIMSARDATKIYARTGGFETAEMGTLGVVTAGGVEFFYQPARKHTVTAEFDLAGVEALPRVGISYSYAGAEGVADTDAKAVVVATTGFAPGERQYYERLRQRGVIVATTFPSGEQVNVVSQATQAGTSPVIAVQHLMPTKARILMMLALTKTQNPVEIQAIFDSY